MKQLEIEFIRNDVNEQKLFEMGFKKEDTGYDFIFKWKGRGCSSITVFGDNSIHCAIAYDTPLSIILNLIEEGIVKVIET